MKRASKGEAKAKASKGEANSKAKSKAREKCKFSKGEASDYFTYINKTTSTVFFFFCQHIHINSLIKQTHKYNILYIYKFNFTIRVKVIFRLQEITNKI